jgi:hypothetical protein
MIRRFFLCITCRQKLNHEFKSKERIKDPGQGRDKPSDRQAASLLAKASDIRRRRSSSSIGNEDAFTMAKERETME